MPQPPPYPADDEDKACDGSESCPASHHIEGCYCAPPPDVYDFYRQHGRWPEPDEA